MSDLDIKIKTINDNNFELLWSEIRRLQSIGRDNREFYKQIQHIKGMRWDGVAPVEVEFSESYPTIPKMNKQQFKYYMYYRTKMLKSEFYMPNWISYIYTFMYEILTVSENIDTKLIKDICEYLINNIKKQFVKGQYGGGGDYNLTQKIEYWLPNILLATEYKRQGKEPANIDEIYYDKYDLALWEGVADYRVTDSEFLNRYFLVDCVKSVLKEIIIEIEKSYLLSELDIIYCLVGNLKKKIDYEEFLHNSVWTNSVIQKFLPIECAKIQYNPRISEKICVVDAHGNTIKQMNLSTKEVWNSLPIYILKSIEVDFMSYVYYRTKLRKPKVDIDKTGIKAKTYEGTVRFFSSDARKRGIQYAFMCEIPNIMEITNKTIKKYIDENKVVFDEVAQRVEADGMCIKKKRKQEKQVTDKEAIVEERIVEKISYDTLQAAREILYKNQERLVIEDDGFMQENQEEQHISVREFTEQEIDLLRILLNHGDLVGYEKKLQETYCTINMIIEKINTKSTDLIGDIVIEEVLGTAQIIDDYIDVCEKWVKCYG